MRFGPFNISRHAAPSAQGKALPAELTGSRGWDSLWKWINPNKWVGASSVFGSPEVKDKEQAHGASPVVYRCGSLIADTVPNARLELGMWLGAEWNPIKNQLHPVFQLIDNPNPDYSRNDFFRYWTLRAALTGNGHTWKVRGGSGGKGGRVKELWPIPTSWVEAIKPQDDIQSISRLVAGYRIFQHNQIVPVQDMMTIRLIDPATTAGAVSPMDSVYHDFRLDLARQDYQAEMLVNMKAPGLTFTFPTIPSADQRKDVESQIESKFGDGNRGKTAVLWGGAEMKAMNPLSDLDWPGITSLNEIRICVGFGVPPILLHLRAGLERSTYSNYIQARQAFMQLTMASWWDSIADTLTRGLLRQEGEQKLQFRFRYDELPEFQESQLQKSTRMLPEFQQGLITIDEYRDAMGYGPAPKELTEKPEPIIEEVPGDDGEDDDDAANEEEATANAS